MTKTIIIPEALKAIGGSEWIRGDKHRIYFNDLPKWYGLQYTTYNTGNVKSAQLDGQPISNSQARGIIYGLDKIWYDVKNGDFSYRGDPEYCEKAIEKIKAEAEKADVPPVPEVEELTSETPPADGAYILADESGQVIGAYPIQDAPPFDEVIAQQRREVAGFDGTITVYHIDDGQAQDLHRAAIDSPDPITAATGWLKKAGLQAYCTR